MLKFIVFHCNSMFLQIIKYDFLNFGIKSIPHILSHKCSIFSYYNICHF